MTKRTDDLVKSATLLAMGNCLAAHLRGDLATAAFAMETVLGHVHRDGEYAARYRLTWLSFALAKVTAEEMTEKHGGCAGQWAIQRTAANRAFEDLPDPMQVALTSVVSCLNDDTTGAAFVVREFTSANSAARAADLLTALVSLHTQTHTGPAPSWLGEH